MTNPIEQEQTYTLTHKEIEDMLKSAILIGQKCNNMAAIDDVLKLWANCIVKIREEEDE